MRIGWGYDIHPLREGRKLVLGGVDVPCQRGLQGHSDADVLIHAICDAILGATGQGDLGRLFPDTDPRFEGIESGVLLDEVTLQARGKGYEIVNVDATIIAQTPRLAEYIPAMEKKLAERLGIKEGQINVKAASPEGIGAIGREEAIAAHSVILMEERKRTEHRHDK